MMRAPLLTSFVATPPRYAVMQARSLEWLAVAHVESETTLKRLDPEARERFAARIKRAIARCACAPDKINRRGQSVGEIETFDFAANVLYDLRNHPRGKGSRARTEVFADARRRLLRARLRERADRTR